MYIKEGSILTFYHFLSVIRHHKVQLLPIAGKKEPKRGILVNRFCENRNASMVKIFRTVFIPAEVQFQYLLLFLPYGFNQQQQAHRAFPQQNSRSSSPPLALLVN